MTAATSLSTLLPFSRPLADEAGWMELTCELEGPTLTDKLGSEFGMLEPDALKVATLDVSALDVGSRDVLPEYEVKTELEVNVFDASVFEVMEIDFDVNVSSHEDAVFASSLNVCAPDDDGSADPVSEPELDVTTSFSEYDDGVIDSGVGATPHDMELDAESTSLVAESAYCTLDVISPLDEDTKPTPSELDSRISGRILRRYPVDRRGSGTARYVRGLAAAWLGTDGANFFSTWIGCGGGRDIRGDSFLRHLRMLRGTSSTWPVDWSVKNHTASTYCQN